MVLPDFLWRGGHFLRICFVIQIQYAVSQIPATQPQFSSEIPQIIDNILKQGIQDPSTQQPNAFNTLTTGTPAFPHNGPEMSKALPLSHVIDFQSMLSMMSKQQPSTTNSGSTQAQPGMEEIMKMLMQSSGQSATPTPEQLGFSHYGPTKQTTKPLTPQQSMLNMLLQQSQGEQSSSNMLLQYLLLMNAMKPATSSASSIASTATSKASQMSAPIPTALSTQIPPTNSTTTSFESNLIRTNSSDVKVSFSGMSNKLGLQPSHAANQNSLRLKRLLLNRLLGNNKLRLKQIRFFHEQNKETVITAANASSNAAKHQLKTAHDLKSSKTDVSTGIHPQETTTLPTSSKISAVSKSQTKFSLPVELTGGQNKQNLALSLTTPMPITLTTPSHLTQSPKSSSVTPGELNSASAAKSWRYPNFQNIVPNGFHQHRNTNSINYQNQQPYQYQHQNQIQYQPVNQAPSQNYHIAQYNNQAAPAYHSNQGHYVAYPNQNIAYPNQNVAYPNQNVAYPNQNVAYPNQNVQYPNQNVANPSMGYDPYSNYAYQQHIGHHGNHGFHQQHQMQFPVPGQASHPMPSDPLLTQVNPPAGPMEPVVPLNAIPSTIDSAEARAEYLEQNPPTEQPPPEPTTPAPVTTTRPLPPTNSNPLHNTRQTSNHKWAEMLHFLSQNFPDYLSLRSQVHQTALSSPMAKQFRSSIATKSNAANPQSKGSRFGAPMANANLRPQWINTTPSTTPTGEPLEVEFEAEAMTTTTSPIHPVHAANAAAARGFAIAKSNNGHIFGGMFGRQIQQRQSNVNSNFNMFGMGPGHNGVHPNGFHSPAHNPGHGAQHTAFFTNGHNPGHNKPSWTHNQNAKWGMNGLI